MYDSTLNDSLSRFRKAHAVLQTSIEMLMQTWQNKLKTKNNELMKENEILELYAPGIYCKIKISDLEYNIKWDGISAYDYFILERIEDNKITSSIKIEFKALISITKLFMDLIYNDEHQRNINNDTTNI